MTSWAIPKLHLMEMAVRHLDFIVDEINRHDPAALPKSALRRIKTARKTILLELAKRKEPAA